MLPRPSTDGSPPQMGVGPPKPSKFFVKCQNSESSIIIRRRKNNEVEICSTYGSVREGK
jgi:hypothetical protein